MSTFSSFNDDTLRVDYRAPAEHFFDVAGSRIEELVRICVNEQVVYFKPEEAKKVVGLLTAAIAHAGGGE